jgi:hypothetical protein
MKPQLCALALLVAFSCGCASSAKSQLGMSQKQWLKKTLIADLVSEDGETTVYKSGRRHYHFKDGVLVKIDQGKQRPQPVELEMK